MKRREFLKKSLELSLFGVASGVGRSALGIPILAGSSNVNAGIWTPMSSTGAPIARNGHAAFWYNGKMLVFGGLSGSTYYNDVYLYDPATDIWTSLGTPTTLAERIGPSILEINGVLIIWGGFRNSSAVFYDTGVRYNGTTWAATSSTLVPSGRYQHSTVTDGTRMFIWGGTQTGGTYTNTGGVYLPSTDTWITTSVSGVPAQRYGHTAVWTSAGMLVWGGFNGSSQGNGAILDPTNTTWTTISNTGLTNPGRNAHTAIWTGTKMIIWGGKTTASASTTIATGAIYTLATDTWSDISNAGAPAARNGHSAYWNGTEMFIWGGAYNGGYRNDMFAYNPVADSWRTVSDGNRINTPSARSAHSGIWTGTDFIVFGGTNGSDLGTGAKFRPF